MYNLVQILRDNEWVESSWHKNYEIAEINAEVILKSKKCPVRIVYDGKIIYERTM
jgi:hypothetical protein